MSTTSQSSGLWTRLLSVILLFNGLLVMPAVSQQYLQQTYCSGQNTGSGNLANSSIYQSLGNCQGICRGSFAFGIVLGKDCWCSNTAPSDQQTTSKCSDTCFGYPYESCGNAGSKLYGYIASDARPGAQSATSPSETSSSARSTSESVSASFSSRTETASSATPITSQSLRTSGGTVFTATVTIMPTGASSENLQSTSKSGISGGAIAGIVIGVIIGAIALLAAIIVALVWWRRRRNELDDGEGGLNRNTSVLSRNVLLGGSRGRGSSGDPYSGNGSSMQERRNSKPLVTDQRLNPNAFMQHDDGSRSSFVSMQDNRDYTRTLNVRNPDPR